MHISLKNIAAYALVALAGFGCTSASELRQVMKDNPEILFDAIESNPEKFAEVVGRAQMKARQLAASKEEETSKAEMEKSFAAPLTPEIAEDRAVRGDRKAPIVLVEYSDFQCPYCQRGYNTVEQLRKKYGKKMLFVFKHYPLDFHPMAMPAALHFEAIALQNAEKAYQFHDELFKNQNRMVAEGEKFFDKTVKKIGGINYAKYKTDSASDVVKARVKADIEEGRKFGMSGTPGYIVTGVPLRGAYPARNFEEIIERRLKDSTLTAAQTR